MPCPGFDALFAAVSEGEADRAMVPIENSLHGSIHENYDRLKTSASTSRGRRSSGSGSASSLGRGRRWRRPPRRLPSRGPRPVPALLRRAAADRGRHRLRHRRRGEGPPAGRPLTQAAIASRLAADLYGGQVLLEGIEDDPENYTRFLILARDARAHRAGDEDLRRLRPRQPAGRPLPRARSLRLPRGRPRKIESRPLRGHPWEYSFYLDVLGDPRGAAGEAPRARGNGARDCASSARIPRALEKPPPPGSARRVVSGCGTSP